MIKKTKPEADKYKLHPKNPSVAPSVDIYNNQSSQLLSLWSWREKLECLLQDNEIESTGTCQITHVTSYQGHHRMGLAWGEQMRSLFTAELWYARNCTQILEKTCCFTTTNDWTQNKHNYLLSWTENTEEMPLYFHLPSSYTVNDNGAKSVVIKNTELWKHVCNCHVGCISRSQQVATIHDSKSH